MRENMALLRWLETAVSGIRFKPDREAVRAELYAHLEDKALDLQRIFPDIDPDEARDRALAGMGDAEEIKVKLAKVHHPWLGYLWAASKVILAVLLALTVLVHFVYLDSPEDNRVFGGWRGYSRQNYAQYGVPAQPFPEKAELGGYTFQITDAAYLDCPEDSLVYQDSIRLVLRVSSPRFWERIANDAIWQGLTPTLEDKTVRFLVDPNRWGLFYRDYCIYLYPEHWSPGDRATLDLSFPRGSLTLSAGVTERVVME